MPIFIGTHILTNNHHPYNGILLINKSLGVSSHTVVYDVRRALGMKKVGHAGTLDPMATGLMILMLGSATKVSQYLTLDDKEYFGTLYLGHQTDSYDSETEVSHELDVPELSIGQINDILKKFTGPQSQLPPMYSAIKVNGRRLYKSARKGQTVERSPREINIFNNELLEYEKPLLKFKTFCSKGTYIRSLAHDIGLEIGCGAYLYQLHRTKSGIFNIEDSITIKELNELSPEEIKNKIIDHTQFMPQKKTVL